MLVTDSDQLIEKVSAVFKTEDIPLELDSVTSEELLLRALEVKEPDLLFIHHHPPSLDVLRIIRRVKSAPFSGEILVIASPSDERVAGQAIIEGAFAYFLDISDHYEAFLLLVKRMINSLRLSRREYVPSLSLEERLRILDRFSSFVAHELKNPFTTINNALYFLKRKIPALADPVFQKYILIIENELMNSNKFLSNLTSVTQKKPVALSPLQVNEILQGLISQIPLSKKITVDLRLDPNLPISLIDRERIQLALYQVIRNAIQAMPEGGNLILQTAHVYNMIEIQVTDQGTGIERDYLPFVFEPFFSTRPRQTGLGLTLAKAAVEAHEGKIYLDSRPGQGTTCIMHLPVRT
ncbi:MAG: two-component system sensor histidine kinase NtrB [bacterium]